MSKTKLKPIIRALKEQTEEKVSVDRLWLINCLQELSSRRWKASGAVFRNKKEPPAQQC